MVTRTFKAGEARVSRALYGEGEAVAAPAGFNTIGALPEEPAAEPDEIVSDSTEGEPIELVAEPLTPEQEAEIEASGVEIPVLTDDSVPPPDAPDEGYDPSEYTVAEVTAYLDENPEQAIYVLDRERAGKARVTLIGG